MVFGGVVQNIVDDSDAALAVASVVEIRVDVRDHVNEEMEDCSTGADSMLGTPTRVEV
jgi:hypothetical protein